MKSFLYRDIFTSKDKDSFLYSNISILFPLKKDKKKTLNIILTTTCTLKTSCIILFYNQNGYLWKFNADNSIALHINEDTNHV